MRAETGFFGCIAIVQEFFSIGTPGVPGKTDKEHRHATR
jgi:hypothetical protein